MPRGRSIATPALCAAILLSCGRVRPARASAPDAEPDFLPYCMAGAAITASWPGPSFAIADFQTDQVAGTITTVDDHTLIKIVILEIYINHTSIGDLVLRLSYQDCATGKELYGTNLLCRPRGTDEFDNVPCGTGTGFGCDGNLGRSPLDVPQPASQRYMFADESPTYMADGACPGDIGSGCYHPTTGGDLTGFTGLPHGGCWQLIVSDWKIGDVGSITSWNVWERDPYAVSAHHSSWGELKVIYR